MYEYPAGYCFPWVLSGVSEPGTWDLWVLHGASVYVPTVTNWTVEQHSLVRAVYFLISQLLVSGKWVLADRVLVRWEHGSFCLAVGPPSFFIYLFGPSGQPPESSRELANDHEAHSLNRELKELCRDKSDLPKPLGQAVEIFLISTSIEHTPSSCIFWHN